MDRAPENRSSQAELVEIAERGFRYALALTHLEPENWHFLNTLGVAQYRAGEHEQALQTLTRSDQLQGGHPADVAFLAMVYHRLGHEEEARVQLSRLRELLSRDDWKKDEESLGFLREAETLIEGAMQPADDHR